MSEFEGAVVFVVDAVGPEDVMHHLEQCGVTIELGPVENADEIHQLHALVVRHHQYTQSAVARRMLDRWDEQVGTFVKVLPTEYRMVLERQHLGANNDMAKLAAV